jgi:fibronectin type 3 domain-containing protein
MKRIAFVLIALLFAISAFAQAAVHKNTLSWAASTTPSATYNVYKAGSCAGTFTRVNTVPITTPTFVDSGMADGAVNCYYVTAVAPGMGESPQSNFVLATTPTSQPAPPIAAAPGAVSNLAQ